MVDAFWGWRNQQIKERWFYTLKNTKQIRTDWLEWESEINFQRIKFENVFRA